MKVHGLLCKKCNTIIYSRARHDFHWCNCPDQTGCFVDGGLDYFRYGSHHDDFVAVLINLGSVTRNELYIDWNLGKSRFGTDNPKIVSFEVIGNNSEE